jgi:hypothetical protein
MPGTSFACFLSDYTNLPQCFPVSGARRVNGEGSDTIPTLSNRGTSQKDPSPLTPVLIISLAAIFGIHTFRLQISHFQLC